MISKFFIRCQNKPLENVYTDIDEALKRFNEIVSAAIYPSGAIWELVAKDPYSKIVLKKVES
jgi:hypothetical protein